MAHGEVGVHTDAREPPAEGRGRRMQDVFRLGREGGQVPGGFYRGLGCVRGKEEEKQDDNARHAGRKEAISIHGGDSMVVGKVRRVIPGGMH